VLHAAGAAAGLETISLWAAVPHYLGISPNPRAARALLEKLSEVTGMEIDVSRLKVAENAWEARVDAVVSADEDMAAYVRRLEEAYPRREDLGQIPSGEELAQEFQRFLSERNGQEED
jgi:proteasome assembly chaperone (PAC2) family protein